MKKDVVRRELWKLSVSGPLTPERVVNFARSPRSPIHHRFQWDDTLAAVQYRLWQARELIASVMIDVQEVKGGPVRGFYNVITEDHGQCYVSFETMLNDKDLFDQAVAEAVRNLEYWEKQTRHLKELSGIFNRAKKAAKKLRK